MDTPTADSLRNQFDQLKVKLECITPGFHNWFLEYKLHEVEVSMLVPTYPTSCWIRKSPRTFYTMYVPLINSYIEGDYNKTAAVEAFTLNHMINTSISLVSRMFRKDNVECRW